MIKSTKQKIDEYIKCIATLKTASTINIIKLVISVLVIFIFSLPLGVLAQGKELVNFSHLESLEFNFIGEDGKKYTSWAIYSQPHDPKNPDGNYHPVEAKGEGYSCADDTSRIAILYMKCYQKTGDIASLQKARSALEFLLYLQAEDGSFYNFVDRQGKINRRGDTSKSGITWWSARCLWAVGMGINIFKNQDPQFCKGLVSSFEKGLSLLIKYRQSPNIDPDTKKLYSLRGITPGTLPQDSGAITSIYTLALLEYYQATRDDKVKKLIWDYCDSMTKMEETSIDRYPLVGFHYPTLHNTDLVHLYGNRQVMALSLAGKTFNNKNWLDSARREADISYPFILSSYGIIFALSPGAEKYPQIAYSVETVVSNLMSVAEVHRQDRFRVLAGLYTSWFFGNNPSGEYMYLPYRGRAFDGIDGKKINTNAGAESTVSALLTMLEIENTHAQEYIYLKSPGLEEGEKLTLNLWWAEAVPVIMPCRELKTAESSLKLIPRLLNGGIKEQVVQMEAGVLMGRSLLIPVGGEYYIYLIYRKAGYDFPGEILCHLEDREKKIFLPQSQGEEQFKSVLLGKTRIKSQETIKIALKNPKKEQEIYLDSIILQPRVQRRIFTSDKKTVILNMNPTPQSVNIPSPTLNFTTPGKMSFYSSQDTLILHLPSLGWMIQVVERNNNP